MAYLELEAYSESWYIQNPRRIQNTVNYLRWNVLQKSNYLAHFKTQARKNKKKSSPKKIPYNSRNGIFLL